MEKIAINRSGRSYGMENAFIAVIVAFLLIVVNLFTFVVFKFELFEVLFLGLVSIVIYAFLLLFLISYSGRRSRRVVDFKKSKVFEGKPSQEPVSMYMPAGEGERLAGDIMDELNMPAEKVDIPHYDYVGSSKTRTYHLKDCKLVKSIAPKFKLVNNGDLFFKKRKFKACKRCIGKAKKVKKV